MAKGKSKAKFWKTDWFLGLLVFLCVFALHVSTDFTESFERRFYDFVSTSTAKKPGDQVVIIEIDDQSIRNIGRWPWPRDVQAKVIDDLAAANAKVIVNTTLFFEPEAGKGLAHLKKIRDFTAAPENAGQSAAEGVQKLADAALADLDNDAKLAASLQKAGNVLLATTFSLGEPKGNLDKPLPEYVSRNMLKSSGVGVPSYAIQAPIERFAQVAAGLGHLNQTVDPEDGVIRRELLLVDHHGQAMPSLALMATAKALNYKISDLVINPETGQVQLGKLKLKNDEGGLLLTQFYEGGKIPKDSFFDVYSGKVPASRFTGKVVIIGGTAAGVGTVFNIPGSFGKRSVFPAELIAETSSALLNEHQFAVPSWGAWASLLAALTVAAYLVFVLPRLSAALGAAMSAGLFVALLVVEFSALWGASLWLKLMMAALLLLIGHLALTTKRFFFTEVGKAKSDTESADTNRMMGLALQGQGRLDEAFDRFRRVPLNDEHGPALLDNMYNLALDFERKRQFNKAQAVYEFMASYDKDYKDLQAKLNRAKNLSETVILGGGGSHPGGTMILGDGSVEKPKLGRYDVEKELGKGAMGVVYLGKDPKIGRVVAIKTMALSQEFEGEELEDARERFFREAETAGRLQHPNIVTIYDAGEEHDLAYIAMEFLKGKDLVDFTKHDTLLPMQQVVSICARVAEALAYAHKQNVVHRDIKPANVMYELSSDTVKVTDFGIARITDSSKTKTGLVLGTPSFMSPEQIAGKKVDGRSDLYSLGVMLFQMLAGVLPFRGDSMAELMYKIANEDAPDIRIIRSEIPVALANVIAIALSKRAETRYQDGAVFAADLRAALMAAPTPIAPSVPAPAPASVSVIEAPQEKTQALTAAAPAADKTVVMPSQNPDALEKTHVMNPVGAGMSNAAAEGSADRMAQGQGGTTTTFASTVPYQATAPWVRPPSSDASLSDNPAPIADPFEKTVITPARKPGEPQA